MRPVSSWLYFVLHKCTVCCGRVCSAAESGAAVVQCAAAELGQKTQTAAAASLQGRCSHSHSNINWNTCDTSLQTRHVKPSQTTHRDEGGKYSTMTFSLQRSLCVGRCSGDSGGLQQNCSCRCSFAGVTAGHHTLLPPARQVTLTSTGFMQFMVLR